MIPAPGICLDLFENHIASCNASEWQKTPRSLCLRESVNQRYRINHIGKGEQNG